jgi:hypothetical protein
MRKLAVLAATTFLAAPLAAQTPLAGQPGVLLYGDIDKLGSGFVTPADSYDGATLLGLAAGTTSSASSSFGHGFPFTPEVDDFAGTDRIYVGSTQTAFHDGYSSFGSRASGPQTFTLDFSSLLPAGHEITTLTLGLGLDDFQFGGFGQPYVGQVNGAAYAPLSTLLNSVNQTGPSTRFYTIGLDVASIAGTSFTVSINQGGTGGDGWAIDYLTVGVQTQKISNVPEPATVALLGGGLLVVGLVSRRPRDR